MTIDKTHSYQNTNTRKKIATELRINLINMFSIEKLIETILILREYCIGRRVNGGHRVVSVT